MPRSPMVPDLHPLWQYQSIRDWLTVKSTNTAKNYIYTFQAWLQWLAENEGLDVDPDQIIELRKSDLKLDDPRENHRWERLVRKYYSEMRKKLSPWGAEYRKKNVQSFFTNNYLQLRFRKGEFSSRPQTVNMKQIPTQEDVQVLYRMSESWRDKSILLLMYQSGMSPIDVTMRNIEDLPDTSGEHVYFEYLRSKTGQKVKTCLSIEFQSALNNHLAARRDNPTEGPVFIGRKRRRMSPIDVSNVIKNAQGKTTVKPFKSKNLRDAYKDALRSGQIDHDIQDWMMGHRGGSGKQYGRAQIMEAYGRAWPFLRVTEAETPVKSELEEKVAALEGELEYLKDAMHGFRDELKKINEQLSRARF